ncbi:extracellular solute-binding protein [Paenibacillus qinlingensis]|uniref:Aldouronate transport system substrate-binding protein n=1 Tax=Paenibacillus qinlingensis TaxID=1837343 RepID=A0ABU1P3D0_9BACL|nr:extracellular solute-binding protein [Paenibacillus qinlingensis]MDR6554251.1 putative aldouronate transport system substrate-binding protein [Paenibacillus qinlingensis]
MLNKKAGMIAAVALSTSLLVTACSTQTGTESQASSPSETSKPAKQETLRILSGVVGGKTPEENALFEKEVERLTGIKVTIEKPAADYDKKLYAAIAAGEKYDLIYMGKGNMDVLVEQGALTQLNDKIKASKVLSDPKVIPTKEWDMITYNGGKIYSVFNKSEGGTLPTVRQDWMDKLKLQQPKTLDDFYQTLKAFKEKDPDGNGKDDTYGLSTAGLYDIQGFMSAAGVKYKYVMDANGKRSIPYATDAAVPIYEWFAKLYKEGILDPNFATNDSGKMRELFLTNRVGMVTYWDAWVGLFNNMKKTDDPKFVAKAIPGAVGPDGKVMLRRGDPSVWGIPVNAEHVDTAMKFLEFWQSDKGNILSTLGIEGTDYTVKDGKYSLTPDGISHGMDHGAPFPNNTNFKNPIGTLPGALEGRQIIFDNNATIENSTKDWPNAEKIVTNYAFQAMMGKMPAADAVKKMRDELKAVNLID